MAPGYAGHVERLMVLALIFWVGCQDRTHRAVTQPATGPTASGSAEAPESDERPSADEPAVVSRDAQDENAGGERRPERPVRRKPKRPVASWVIFREAFEPSDDAACTVAWTSGNRLEVHTENIQRLTIDLTRLPEGAPTKGPWNLQIDGQGIEMTGFRPKVGYTGKIRDLVRSQNGNWTVDRQQLYRLGG